MMASVSLGEAAKLTGLNRTSILRAVRRGQLTAQGREDGRFLVDVAELERVYQLRHHPDAQEGASGGQQKHEQAETHQSSTARIATLEGEIKGLQAKIEGLEALLAEVRTARDLAQDEKKGMREQLRMALAALPPPTSPRRPWWSWRR